MVRDSFIEEWSSWQARRLRAVTEPLGIASLDSTNWLSTEGLHIPGIAGRWRLDGGGIVGEGLADSGYLRPEATGVEREVGDSVRMVAGEELRDGERRLRAEARSESLLLRVYDPTTPRRVSLTGIDIFPPDPRWRAQGSFVPGSGRMIEIPQMDGGVRRQELGGTVDMELDDQTLTLTVTHGARGGYSAVFGDGTNGTETYRFRFLELPDPDPDGQVVVDFNRAYLPPCAFSDHYICPLPPPGNRFQIPIRAGERFPIYLS